MSLGKPDINLPPIRERPPLRVQPEVQRAKIDEEERRKRITMNRAKSRLTKPILDDIIMANKNPLSDKL